MGAAPLTVGHLTRRFVGSLWPAGPRTVDDAWARTQLSVGEIDLWVRLGRVDRRHACGVARRVERALGGRATRPVLAAALLHDVGKLDAGLGTYGRVVATLSGAVAGRDMAKLWRAKTGITRRIGLYLCHDELGADHLTLAGSDPFTIAWAREHHRPADQWSLPGDLAAALKAADGD